VDAGCVEGKALTVSTLFWHCKDGNRRIYVFEVAHLTLNHNTIFKETKRMNLFSRVFTRGHCVGDFVEW
jgi:hypothetical protein